MKGTASVQTAQPEFSSVTEQPGQRASRLQLAMLAARYTWAATYAAGRDVLEVACGAGLGLGILADVARTVEAGDLDPALLAAARSTYAADRRISIRPLDAQELPFPDDSFDLLLLFEAVYYLPSAPGFLREARRVLRPCGHLLIATVNREWSGFNASPFHTRYLSAAELRASLEEARYSVQLQAGFPEQRSPVSEAIGALRRAAVALGLVPRTMGGKALLKRLFYGRLDPVPARIERGSLETPLATLVPLEAATDLARYRVLYAAARKDS